MRFCSPDDGELEERVELGLDFGLECEDGSDDISAVRFDYQRYLSLRSAPVHQLELSLVHKQNKKPRATYLHDLTEPLLDVTARLAQKQMTKRCDLRADTWRSNRVDRDMHGADLLYERALLELMARASGERGVQSGEEPARLRCHNASGHTSAVCQPYRPISVLQNQTEK